MKNYLFLIAGLLIGGAVVFIYMNNNINKISTEEIDKELEKLNKKITILDTEIAKYKSGLLPSLLNVQRAIYEETVAALELKKAQFSHWINLNYNIKNPASMPYGEVHDYDKEITKLEEKIQSDKKESDKYKPCLIKSLIDTRIAQTQLLLSSIERAKIAKQFNLPFLEITNKKETEDSPPLIQSQSEDKDSL